MKSWCWWAVRNGLGKGPCYIRILTLGFDRTENVGPQHLTLAVFEAKPFVKENRQTDHPTLICGEFHHFKATKHDYDEFFFVLRKYMKINAHLAAINENGQVTDAEGHLLCGSDFESAIINASSFCTDKKILSRTKANLSRTKSFLSITKFFV